MEQLKLYFALQPVELDNIDYLTERQKAEIKGDKRYSDGLECSQGHIAEKYTSSGKCCRCREIQHKKTYAKSRDKILARQAKWKVENKQRISDQGKEYRAKNETDIKRKKSEAHKRDYEEIKKRRAPYFKKNREKILKKKREYFENNKEILKERRSIRHKEKMKIDKNYRFMRKIRSVLRKSIERTGSAKNGRVRDVIGYSCYDLIADMKTKFKNGMSWDNHGEWHIDHIKPVKAFLNEGITDPKIINALDNLQPLWAEENLRKAAKYDPQD